MSSLSSTDVIIRRSATWRDPSDPANIVALFDCQSVWRKLPTTVISHNWTVSLQKKEENLGRHFLLGTAPTFPFASARETSSDRPKFYQARPSLFIGSSFWLSASVASQKFDFRGSHMSFSWISFQIASDVFFIIIANNRTVNRGAFCLPTRTTKQFGEIFWRNVCHPNQNSAHFLREIANLIRKRNLASTENYCLILRISPSSIFEGRYGGHVYLPITWWQSGASFKLGSTNIGQNHFWIDR